MKTFAKIFQLFVLTAASPSKSMFVLLISERLITRIYGLLSVHRFIYFKCVKKHSTSLQEKCAMFPVVMITEISMLLLFRVISLSFS